jgi:hypothetical protein
MFAFTGRIPDWPREAKLYPVVRRLGGKVVDTLGQIVKADYLVKGIFQGDRKETRKLVRAREHAVPIKGWKQFLKMLE